MSPRPMALLVRPGHDARQAPAVNSSNEKNAVVPIWLNWVYILTWGTLAATNAEAMTAPQRPAKRPPRTAAISIEATPTAHQNPYRDPARNSHGSGDGPESHRPILSRTTCRPPQGRPARRTSVFHSGRASQGEVCSREIASTM